MSQSQEIDYFRGLKEIVQIAIEEDLGTGDITAQLVPEDQIVSAYVITRETAIVCGRPWFDEVFRQIDPTVALDWQVTEGQEVTPDQELVNISGNARSILTAERCALNFLQTLMATATSANQYASKVADCPTKILDTRKTIPGLRLAQKYAVKTGGAENHRIGLYDAFLIKENHIAACGSIKGAVDKAHQIAPGKKVQIEVETIQELEEALASGANTIMLDNFSENMLKAATAIKKGNVFFEISGNITSETLSKLSRYGVDFISSGALTKHVKAIDLSLRILSS